MTYISIVVLPMIASVPQPTVLEKRHIPLMYSKYTMNKLGLTPDTAL